MINPSAIEYRRIWKSNRLQIDWNKVAHDPILSQEITNGHAARMRYSRFRSAMLGLEPTRRNRTGPPKSRVTKSKKDPKAKRDGSMKPESPVATPAPQEPTETSAPKIKQESLQRSLGSHQENRLEPRLENRLENRLDNRLENRLTPGFTPGLTPGPMPAPSPSVASSHTMQARLLTPCSDTDVFGSTMRTSPASDLISSQPPSFDFSQPPCPSHDECGWHPAMAYAPFSNPYVFDDFTAAHQHLHHQHDHFGVQLPSIETDGDMNVDVKHESWDNGI